VTSPAPSWREPAPADCDPDVDAQHSRDALIRPGRRVPAPPLRLTGAGSTPKLRGWLHFAAFVVAIPAGAVLVRRGGDRASLVVYAVALVTLYGVSSAYHLVPMPSRARRWMRRVDHAVIYVFIAGAFTPFCLLVAPGTEGHVVLALAWAGAAAGVTIKMIRFERTRVIGGAFYLVLGWLALAVVPVALRRLDAEELALLVVMGVMYTGGSVVLATRRPDPAPDVFGYHEVWHAMVVLATACYYLVLWCLTAHAGR
jgi:hemolysin III